MPEPTLKTCQDCREQFNPAHGNAKRCPDCADKHRKAKESEKATARRADYYNKVMDTYFDLMRDERCGCCGCDDKRVLGFYRPDTMAPFTIGKARTMTLDDIRAEAGKCKVHCANCHQIAVAEAKGQSDE
jgi:hypothetical protein